MDTRFVRSSFNALAWRPSKSTAIRAILAMLPLISLKMMGSEQIWYQVVQLLVLLLLVTVVIWREKRLQRQLTSPPLVHNNNPATFDPKMEAIRQRMSRDGLLTDDIKPSLFFGTNRWIATLAGFIIKGPKPSTDFLRFRQLLIMHDDQATIALDWELLTDTTLLSAEERKCQILLDGCCCSISQPVVLILHGIGNSTTTGYMRSLMRSCAEQGWIAVGMNYRGCGGSPVTAPFGYNGAYTGDLRAVVQTIASKMTPGTPLLLVGHSIGANLVTKYLGEEGRRGTLPSVVVAGVSLANPCDIRSDRWSFPMAQALNLVAKKILLQTIGWYLPSLLRTPKFRRALGRAFVSFTMKQFDTAVAPILLRNAPHSPFTTNKGYRSAAEYWEDAGSYQYARHVTVPLLHITSQDDFLVYHSYKERLSFYQNNPKLILVETKTGGHLGWYEAATSAGLPKSWAERATVSYLQAIVSSHRTSSNVAMQLNWNPVLG